MLEHQQPDGNQRQNVHDWMNISPTANHKIKANMRNEAPEYSLGDRKGQGDEDYSQKRRKTFLDFDEVYGRYAFEHRSADQHQYRRGRKKGHHPRQRGQEEAREKT